MGKDPIEIRVQALAETMDRYVKEAEAVHGEIDRNDVDLWDLLACKAALELWGKLRILTIDPLGELTAEQKLAFEGIYKKHFASMGEFERSMLNLERVEWDEKEQLFKVYFACGQWWHYTLDGFWY